METPRVDDWVRRYRKHAVTLCVITTTWYGFTDSVGSTAGFLLAALALASSITLFCFLDAQLHGKVFLRSFAWLMFLTWPVGILAHLVWTRGARGVLTYLAAVAGFLFFGLIGSALGTWVTG